MGISVSYLRGRTWVVLSFATILVLATVATSGCALTGGEQDPGGSSSVSNGGTSSDATVDTSGSETTQTTTLEGTDLQVYFLRDEQIACATRTVPATVETGAAAIDALLAGPTEQEEEAGMFTAIPEGVSLLGLTITEGVATVDLSQEYASGGGSLSMFARLAQVVFTLTQFPTVDSVLLKMDGVTVEEFSGEGIVLDGPLARDDYEDLSPAILVESPTMDTTASSPLRITGTANVFEAVFQVNIVDGDELIIAEQTVTATSGTGTRGTFDVTVPFTLSKAGPGALIVFAESPKDGSQIDIVEIPLHLVDE